MSKAILRLKLHGIWLSLKILASKSFLFEISRVIFCSSQKDSNSNFIFGNQSLCMMLVQAHYSNLR